MKKQSSILTLECQMNSYFSHKYNLDIISLLPGEFATSRKDVLSTVLGTCISVILYSKKKKIGGMNHFMLPKNKSIERDGIQHIAGKYGINAMELLINSLMKHGVNKNELVAKVFGGGSMFSLNTSATSKQHVGLLNIDFAIYYLEEERIPIISQDTGGVGGRKILFFPETGNVLLSKIKRPGNLIKEEDKYSNRISKNGGDSGEKTIILF